MGKFASGIAALPRIVTLHDIEIVRRPDRARCREIPANSSLNVTAKTYRYLDEDAQASGKNASGKKKADGRLRRNMAGFNRK